MLLVTQCSGRCGRRRSVTRDRAHWTCPACLASGKARCESCGGPARDGDPVNEYGFPRKRALHLGCARAESDRLQAQEKDRELRRRHKSRARALPSLAEIAIGAAALGLWGLIGIVCMKALLGDQTW